MDGTPDTSPLLAALMRGIPPTERDRLVALIRQREDLAPPDRTTSAEHNRPASTDGRRHVSAAAFQHGYQWQATVPALSGFVVRAASREALAVAVAVALARCEGRPVEDYVVRLDCV